MIGLSNIAAEMEHTMTARSAERTRFLAGLLVTAIDHNGYGFSEVVEDNFKDGDEANWFASIKDRTLESDDPDYGATRHVDLDTMARGLSIIRDAIPATGEDGRETFLVNAETFERLYFGGHARDQLLLADRTNGEDGDYDVISALAVMECALFGSVVFA